MFNTQTAYGGGIGLWSTTRDLVCHNNGMDGDCWSANNVMQAGPAQSVGGYHATRLLWLSCASWRDNR